MKKLLLTFLLFAFIQIVSFAQSSVYFCKYTGAVGVCYGNYSAANCAYNTCLSYGGTNPQNVLTSYSKGYGAVAIGYNSFGGRVIGTVAGYSNLAAARNAALQAAYNYGALNPYIHSNWADF